MAIYSVDCGNALYATENRNVATIFIDGKNQNIIVLFVCAIGEDIQQNHTELCFYAPCLDD